MVLTTGIFFEDGVFETWLCVSDVLGWTAPSVISESTDGDSKIWNTKCSVNILIKHTELHYSEKYPVFVLVISIIWNNFLALCFQNYEVMFNIS
jgi:hypothetical protein